MEQGVYVDVLLATNYAVNLCIILCVARFSGRSPKRCRIVAAALLGAATSLTIFLPLMALVPSVLVKLGVSAAVVLAAFGYISAKAFWGQMFLFFAISFCFAGVMLGLWLLLEPPGMSWNNGVVYFDISPLLLICSTVAAYLLLSLFSRVTRGKSLPREIYPVRVHLNGRAAAVRGMVDTGNRLREPFSGSPVVVCRVSDLTGILPPNLVEAVLQGKMAPESGIPEAKLPRLRVIPYANIGAGGALPAFKPDKIVIDTQSESLTAEEAYVGISRENIGDGEYNCLLNPELITFKTQKQLKVAAK